MNIFLWLHNRRLRATAIQREQGYNYAAGQLLRGVPILEVEAEAENPWDHNEFNYGMTSAILAWEAKDHGQTVVVIPKPSAPMPYEPDPNEADYSISPSTYPRIPRR